MAMSSSTAGPSRQPTKPPVVQPGSGNAVIINPCQRLNPLLECIRNVTKEFGDIVPDFQLGRTTCALFLSLKYHRLHPEYIHQRIQKLGHLYTLRLLLLMCDINEHQEHIRELTKICVLNNITIIVSWSNEEAGAYLSTYKAFEHRPPDLIKERVDKEYNAMLRAALTSINKVNKTDVETLRTSFGSFAKIAHASPEELRRLPGFGQVKVRRIVDAFNRPFRNKATSAFPSSSQAQSVLQAQEELENDHMIEQDEHRLLDMDEGDNTKTGKTHENVISSSSRVGPSTQTTNTASNTSTARSTSSKRVHHFGSAADMPSPPPPSVPVRTPREPSPVWDIELDLNEPEGEVQGAVESDTDVDPRLAKKKWPGVKDNGTDEGEEGETNADEACLDTQQQANRRQRSPSPVWDIELDLNEDDL